MHRPFARYSWDLRACGRHGHVLYEPTEVEIARRLTVSTPAGDAWRCLRCGTYVPTPGPVPSGPAADAPIVLRGNALKDATILRLLAAERLMRAVLLVTFAYGVYRFDRSKSALQRTLDADLPLLRPLADRLHIALYGSTPIRVFEKAVHYQHRTLVWVMLGLSAYAGLQLAEGIGLWSLKRWGEYVGAVGTSVLLPLEIYDIYDRVTVLRVVLFLINVAAVVYLVWTKHLFGTRGGRAAYEAERHSVSLLEVEDAAMEPEGPPGAQPGR